MIRYSVYADGSSGGNSTGAIGWGAVVLGTIPVRIIAAVSGGLPVGTNNVAELMGAREGIRALLKHLDGKVPEPFTVELVSDSMYVLGLANGSYSPTKNVALAEHLRAICKEYNILTRWVRGHAGDPLNEMCDRLAKAGKAKYAPPKVRRPRGAARRRKR